MSGIDPSKSERMLSAPWMESALTRGGVAPWDSLPSSLCFLLFLRFHFVSFASQDDEAGKEFAVSRFILSESGNSGTSFMVLRLL